MGIKNSLECDNRDRGEEHFTHDPITETALDRQVGGNHYKGFKIQPIVFSFENDIPAVDSNIIKYICRHRFKGGAEDLKKAKHLIDFLLEHEYGNYNI